MNRTRNSLKKKNRPINGDKREQLGISLGIQDKNGLYLFTGDIIQYANEECIILFNKDIGRYQAMLTRSCWYGDRELYNPNCYGKSYDLPMDNGARMEILKTKSIIHEMFV